MSEEEVVLVKCSLIGFSSFQLHKICIFLRFCRSNDQGAKLLCTLPDRRPDTAVDGERARPAGGKVVLYYLMICPYQVQKKITFN